MSFYGYDFSGIGEPTAPEDQVKKVDLGRLDPILDLIVKEKILSEREQSKFDRERKKYKQKAAVSLIGVLLGVLAITLIVGTMAGHPDLADRWWAFIGPILGYLVRILFEGPTAGRNGNALAG